MHSTYKFEVNDIIDIVLGPRSSFKPIAVAKSIKKKIDEGKLDWNDIFLKYEDSSKISANGDFRYIVVADNKMATADSMTVEEVFHYLSDIFANKKCRDDEGVLCIIPHETFYSDEQYKNRDDFYATRNARFIMLSDNVDYFLKTSENADRGDGVANLIHIESDKCTKA